MNWQPIPSVTAPHYLDTNLNQVQKCVNWYYQKTPDGYVLASLQGYQTKGTVANNAACRGSKFDPTSSQLFSAHGNKVYLINPNGSTLTALAGSLTTASGPVVFASGLASTGQGQMLLVDGTNGYVINTFLLTVTQITDANFPSNPISCACFNGQYIVLKGGSDRWYMSAVDDGATWTPVISGRALTNGDQLYHVEVVRDTVYFMGRYSIEPWYASSVDPYLQPVTGAVMPVGVIWSLGVARVGDAVLFYGVGERSRGSIWMISGGQLSEVAPHYIKDKIGEWIVGPSRSFAYTNQGVDFFEVYNDSVANFGGWCFSISAGTWSEASGRNLYSAANGDTGGGPPLGFSKDDGKVYWLGDNSQPYNSHDGSAIIRVLDFKLDGGISRIFNSGLRFEFEAQHDSSSNPTLSMLLQKSDDGGRTFDTGITISKSITNGTSAQQVLLQTPPLGSAKAGRVYRATISSFTGRLILRRAEGLVRVGRF